MLRQGAGERARGLGCGGPLDAGARERKSGGALSRAIHGGGEVAAGGAVGARGTGRRAPVRGQKSGEGLGHDAWVPRRAGGGRGRTRAGGGAAPVDRGSRKGGRRKKKLDFFVNSEKISGPTVKLKYLLN